MIKHITTTNEFDALILKGKVLVDFYANWCGPCQMLTPILEEIDESKVADDVLIVKVNVDEFMDIASRYSVQSIPLLLLFNDGKLVDSRLGYQNKNQLLKFLGK